MSGELDVYKEWLGIPEGPRPPDHYALLRVVQFEDDTDRIRGNYKKLNSHVRKYATGQYSVRSQELLNELAKAMLCLTDVERKREYDLGMGREFGEELPGGRKLMETILVEQKYISMPQLKEAKEYAEKRGLELRDAVVQLKMVDPVVAAQALASERGLSFVDLADMLPDDDVLDQVHKSIVKQHSILPLFIDDDTLLVASVDLIDPNTEEELRLIFDKKVRTVMAAPQAINQGIAKYYAPGERKEPAAKTKGGAAKATKTAAAKPARAARPTAAASAEEKQKNKSIGIILICWAVIGVYLLDNFVITPGAAFNDMYSLLLAVTIIPAVSLFAYFTYLK